MSRRLSVPFSLRNPPVGSPPVPMRRAGALHVLLLAQAVRAEQPPRGMLSDNAPPPMPPALVSDPATPTRSRRGRARRAAADQGSPSETQAETGGAFVDPRGARPADELSPPASAALLPEQPGGSEQPSYGSANGPKCPKRQPRGGPSRTRWSLSDAAEAGDLEMVREMLERGMTDVNNQAKGGSGATALSLAAAQGNIEVVRLLLSAGADPNSQGKINGQTPLLRSITRSAEQSAGNRLNRSATDSIDLTDTENTTSDLAVDIDIARLLLEAGADVDKANFEGGTPVMYAAGLGEERAGRWLDILFELHARLDLVADNGTMRGATALGCAAITVTDRANALRRLLAAGAPIDQVNMFGSTALIRAARGGKVEAVRILLDHGARTDLKTHATPDCEERGDFECRYVADALQWLSIVVETPERTECGKLIRRAIRARARTGANKEHLQRGNRIESDTPASSETDSGDDAPQMQALQVGVMTMALLLMAALALSRGRGEGSAHSSAKRRRRATFTARSCRRAV